MARPRKFIRITEAPDGSISLAKNGNGREIHGLSYNASNRSYYTIVAETGKREYLGRDLVSAVRKMEGGKGWTPAQQTALDTTKEIADTCLNLAYGGAPGKQTNVPNQTALEIIRDFVKSPPAPDKPSKQRLSDCLKTWVEWQDDANTPNVIQNEKRFRAFTRCVGNLPISTIRHSHFVKWQLWVKKQSSTKWSSVKTGKDHHATVYKILAFAKRKNRDWKFPDGLLEWAIDWKDDKEGKTPYVPKKSNSEPMPVDVYRRCLAVADEWASLDIEQYDATTQKGRGRRRQAIIKKRQGVQFAALLRLIIHGLDTVDCTRIRWANLRDLDGDMPYLDFPRRKMQHKTGYAIDRKTPLLPACVAALKRWREYEKPARTIFKNAQGAAYNSSTLATAFGKLRENQDWSLKHLRNVGSSLADQNGMSEMIVDRFLGHTLKKPRAKYLGTVGPEYLADLVKLIGERYLGNSQADAGKKSA